MADNILIERLPAGIDREAGSPFHYAPAGDLVAFVTLKGDLQTNATTAHLRVFGTRALQAFASGGATPTVLFEHAVASLEILPAIGSLTWSPDGAALFYLLRGQGPSEADKVMLWSSPQGKARLVAQVEGTITAVKVVGNDRIALLSPYPQGGRHPVERLPFEPVVMTGRPLHVALGGRDMVDDTTRPQRLLVVDWRQAAPPREYDVVTELFTHDIHVAPGGRSIAYVEPMFVEWTGSCWRETDSLVPADALDVVDRRRARIAIVDVESGDIVRPFSGPVGTLAALHAAPDVVWSPDGRYAVAPYVFTERDRCGADGGARSPTAFLLSADGTPLAPIHRYETGEDGHIARRPSTVEWSADSTRVTLTHLPVLRSSAADTAPRRIVFERVDDDWRLVDKPRKPSNEPAGTATAVLEVRQELNVPPAIYALGPDGSARMLHDLAPHARGRVLNPVEPFTWQDSAGRTWRGVLAMPGRREAGRRYPLILQTHADDDAPVFFAEGPTTTAFPGRAAIARGFVVLTIEENREAVMGARVEEGPNIIDGYRTAIAALAARGLIDPARVGVVGWSRTAYHVKYALVHAPELFRAAVAVDGVDYGYLQYLNWLHVVEGGFSQQYEELYGGTPWGNWNGWLQQAPGMNLHRVRAPLRAEANSRIPAILSEWEFYAGLRRLGKPVDLIFYPQGEHWLVRPLERRVSTEGSLDWLDYWLNGHRDPAADKRAQYARWDAMR